MKLTDALMENRNLFWTIVNQCGDISPTMDVDDMFQELFIRAMEAVHIYDPKRGRLSNFLGRVLWRRIMQLREANKPIPEDYNPNRDPDNGRDFYRHLLEDLRVKVKDFSEDLSRVLEGLVEHGGNQKALAQSLGKSTFWVNRKVMEIRKSNPGREVLQLI